MESSPPSSNLTDIETKNLIINVLRKWKFVPYIPQDELSAILIPWIVESSSKPDLILAVINELWESYINVNYTTFINTVFTGLVQIAPIVIQEIWEDILFKLLSRYEVLSRYECMERKLFYNVNTIAWMIGCLNEDVCPNSCLRLELVSFLTSVVSNSAADGNAANITLPISQKKLFVERGCRTLCDVSREHQELNSTLLPNSRAGSILDFLNKFVLYDEYCYSNRLQLLVSCFRLTSMIVRLDGDLKDAITLFNSICRSHVTLLWSQPCLFNDAVDTVTAITDVLIERVNEVSWTPEYGMRNLVLLIEDLLLSMVPYSWMNMEERSVRLQSFLTGVTPLEALGFGPSRILQRELRGMMSYPNIAPIMKVRRILLSLMKLENNKNLILDPNPNSDSEDSEDEDLGYDLSNLRLD